MIDVDINANLLEIFKDWSGIRRAVGGFNRLAAGIKRLGGNGNLSPAEEARILKLIEQEVRDTRPFALYINPPPTLFEAMRQGHREIFYPIEDTPRPGDLMQACNRQVTGRQAGKNLPAPEYQEEIFRIVGMSVVDPRDRRDVR